LNKESTDYSASPCKELTDIGGFSKLHYLGAFFAPQKTGLSGAGSKRKTPRFIDGVSKRVQFFFGAKRESMIYLWYPKGGDTDGYKRTGKTHNRRRSGI
jgi:hypothetical protein